MKIIHGDCIEQMAALPAASVDCIVTDPPYGQTSLPWDSWVQGWADAAARVLKPSGSMWCFGTLRMFMRHADAFTKWRFSHDVVWEKHNGAGFANDRFRGVHEIAAHFYLAGSKWGEVYKAPQYTLDARPRVVRRKERPTHITGARGPSNYVSVDGGPRLQRSVVFVRSEHGRAEHPTQKPEGILEPLIRYACPPGGTVFDPFAGSGAVGVTALRLGFGYIGVEADPKYHALASRKLDLAEALA